MGIRVHINALAGLVLLIMSLAACASATNDSDVAAPDNAGDQIALDDLPEVERSVAGAMMAVLSAPSEAWPGFDPADYPTVVAIANDDDSVAGAFVLNHPAPGALGDAAQVVGVEVESLYYVAEPSGIPTPANTFFDFDVDIGGTPTYVVLSRSSTGQPLEVGSINLTELLSHGTPAWQSLLVHEMFHLYQGREWNESFADQETYDFIVDNFELSLLEDQALITAYNSTGDESDQAIRHFVALRAIRLEMFPSTQLDERQEVAEGTAQWIEWVTVRPDTQPWVDRLYGDLSDPEGFTNNIIAINEGTQSSGPDTSRWYLTGATMSELLERSGIDWQPALIAGSTQSELLRAEYPVTEAERDQVLAEALQAYDPDGTFVGLAEKRVDAALSRGGVMSDASAGLTGAEAEAEEVEIVEDELTRCLEDFGYDIAAIMEAGGEVELSDEAIEACI